jgi:hypothetical protein
MGDSGDAPAPQTAVHLPLADLPGPTGYRSERTPSQAGTGFRRAISTSTARGVYFVNEEVARANGFVNAD